MTGKTTNPAHPEWAVDCPLSLFEAEADAITYWRDTADFEGLSPTGPLTVILVPVPEEHRPLYGCDQSWRVSGEVTRKVEVQLPTFVPSTAAVEAAAARLGREFDPSLIWEDASAQVKNYWTRITLAAFNAAGAHLVADSARHLSQHASSYGAPALLAQPQLAELHADLHKRLND